MRMARAVFLSALCLLYSTASATTVNTFYPFLSQEGADPWVFKHPTNGFYYATKSTQNNVVIWRSRQLSTLDVGESKEIWTANNSTACRSVWAPELHLIAGRWYVYFAATTCDDDNKFHRMFVLENKNDEPFQGQFEFRGQLTDETNKWAIDGTVFEHPRTNDLYFIWSGWEGDVDVMQVRTHPSPMQTHPLSLSGRFSTSLTCPIRTRSIRPVWKSLVQPSPGKRITRLTSTKDPK